MSLRDSLKKYGMALAMGATVLTAGPAAVADTAPTPPSTSDASGRINLHEYVKQRDAARKASGDGATTMAASCYSGYLTSMAAGRIVSVEIGYAGSSKNMLRARAISPGAWEQLTICWDSQFDYIYSVAADRYVSAEVGYTGSSYGMLRARATSVGPWERFYIGCSSACQIKSVAANAYVTTELDYTGSNSGMLRARRTGSAGSWEQFAF
ncbi:fascin domain-containing protein [Nonomuraea jiangxiensis]|uniref:Uncharacterized protein n=1 Tax=Nonomuraea jiangxiensis TaxID=633440 RepID=A0A1G9QWP4_9ACTN|nr:hypothetical protein [Nonomuraea jiangxiensis]SDM15429.1 hypothetical protein SAMN05421869_13740 [Nonomuraea jiangxiensis]